LWSRVGSGGGCGAVWAVADVVGVTGRERDKLEKKETGGNRTKTNTESAL